MRALKRIGIAIVAVGVLLLMTGIFLPGPPLAGLQGARWSVFWLGSEVRPGTGHRPPARSPARPAPAARSRSAGVQ
jgi:hypothetical protein